MPKKTAEALASEYRPSMDKDVLHAWAADAVEALRTTHEDPPGSDDEKLRYGRIIQAISHAQIKGGEEVCRALDTVAGVSSNMLINATMGAACETLARLLFGLEKATRRPQLELLEEYIPYIRNLVNARADGLAPELAEAPATEQD